MQNVGPLAPIAPVIAPDDIEFSPEKLKNTAFQEIFDRHCMRAAELSKALGEQEDYINITYGPVFQVDRKVYVLPFRGAGEVTKTERREFEWEGKIYEYLATTKKQYTLATFCGYPGRLVENWLEAACEDSINSNQTWGRGVLKKDKNGFYIEYRK